MITTNDLMTDEFGSVDTICHRIEVAERWLQGAGIEIGALHRPLVLPDCCTVQYVDYKSASDNRKCYPELEDFSIVDTNIIDNGFYLEAIPISSQDYVIANHVLEHSPDPYGTLQCWKNKLRRGGILYITIPIAERCFDHGRQLTSVHHMLEDHERFICGAKEEILENTKQHILEFITISGQNIRRENNLSDATQQDMQTLFSYLSSQLESQLSRATTYYELIDSHTNSINRIYDIHYHTFSPSSFEKFLKVFTQETNCTLKGIYKSGGGECIGIISFP